MKKYEDLSTKEGFIATLEEIFSLNKGSFMFYFFDYLNIPSGKQNIINLDIENLCKLTKLTKSEIKRELFILEYNSMIVHVLDKTNKNKYCITDLFWEYYDIFDRYYADLILCQLDKSSQNLIKNESK